MVLPDVSGGPPEPRGNAFAAVDGRGVLVRWSPGAQRLLGYSAEEIQGSSCLDLLCAQDAEQRADELIGRCREPEGYLGAVALRARDGSSVDAVLWAHRLEGAAGEEQWLLQAESEEAARHHELRRALLRGLFKESPFLIDVFDDHLRFLAQNESQVRSSGFAEDVLGRTMREVAPEGLLNLDEFEERQHTVLASGRAQIGVEILGRAPEDPDRDKVWSETILPLRGDSGDVIALAHAVFEVTGQVRARERLGLVNDASARIGSRLDVLSTAQELTDVAVPRFADYTYVNILDSVFGGEEPGRGPVSDAFVLRRAAESVVGGMQVETLVARGEVDPFASGPGSPAALALANGRPVLLTGEQLFAEIATMDLQRAALIRERGVHSWLLVPMYARGTPLGTVVFLRFQRAHRFEDDDVLLAQDFVARAGVCIDNASRYTRERKTALALQRSLLPQQLPCLTGVETVSRYVPASGRTVLGGAWFDVIPLSGARVALVVGDAAGRGLHAAVTMGRIRTAVRTLADLDLSPAELLTHLDAQAKRSDEGEGIPFIDGAEGSTLMYAVIDPITRHCEMAGSGHPPPALMRANGQVSFAGLRDNVPLGSGGAPFDSHEVVFSDGDALVLYTSGLEDPPGSPGREASPDTLLQRLSAVPHAAEPGTPPTLDDMCDHIVRTMIPEHPSRDVALLAARMTGLQAHRHVTWDLSAEPEVVHRARAMTKTQLSQWRLEELEFTTELIVSELVTNAIRYGTPPIRLRLIHDRSLICEVSDSSSTSPHVRRAMETDEGGRGLYMVAQIARLWGTRYHARGKSIWAEQPLPAHAPAP